MKPADKSKFEEHLGSSSEESVVQDNENNSDAVEPQISEQGERQSLKWITKMIQTYPRTFFVLRDIMIPILIMIALCFLFGYFVANAESNGYHGNSNVAKFGLSTSGEKDGNDEAMRTMYMQYLDGKEQDIVDQTDIITRQNTCIENLLNIEETDNITQTLNISSLTLESIVTRCIVETIPVSNVSASEFIIDLILTSQNGNEFSMNFDWTYCTTADQNILTAHSSHNQYAASAWLESYQSTYNMYVSSGMIQDEATLRAIQEATGMTGCHPNVLAGAVYWSTLMTTVGYGSVIVTSHVTRWLSYTFGFFSILLFLAVVMQSATILIAVIDDFAIEFNLRRLAKGFTSCLCWFISLWSMIILIGFLAFTSLAYRTSLDVAQTHLPISEFLWFSYISVTTVGFGEYNTSAYGKETEWVFLFVFLVILGHVLVVSFYMKVHHYYMNALTVDAKEAYDTFQQSRLFISRMKDYRIDLTVMRDSILRNREKIVDFRRSSYMSEIDSHEIDTHQ